MAQFLETLCIVEATTFPGFSKWQNWEWLKGTMHLTIGVISHDDTSIANWVPPLNLETLTMLVEISPKGSSDEILERVYFWLVSTLRAKKLKSLRAFTLNLVLPVRKDRPPISAVDPEIVQSWKISLEESCHSADIGFTIGVISKKPPFV